MKAVLFMARKKQRGKRHYIENTPAALLALRGLPVLILQSAQDVDAVYMSAPRMLCR